MFRAPGLGYTELVLWFYHQIKDGDHVRRSVTFGTRIETHLFFFVFGF